MIQKLQQTLKQQPIIYKIVSEYLTKVLKVEDTILKQKELVTLLFTFLVDSILGCNGVKEDESEEIVLIHDPIAVSAIIEYLALLEMLQKKTGLLKDQFLKLK